MIFMKQLSRRFLLFLLLFSFLFQTTAYASTDWPQEVALESDAGIVMDADSGAVLYGKNIHLPYAPASITKVLTALIVLERCSMDETVTFSQNAVYNVESNSSSAGYDTGDTASVEDCLYALLLKSANESANALAEHVAGTTEEFAVLMNEKAAELRCQDSHFANPSGLNDDEHYVSAYDMALITRAAFEIPEFEKIVSTTYYHLPPNKQNPEGQGISPGNKMIKKNWPEQYRPEVIGGKTGYTSIALNTLVNGAKQGDTRLITVILHSNSTQYDDTKRLLDFGFSNFQSVRIADYDQTFSTIGDDLKIAGLPTSEEEVLTIDPESRIILPKTADFSETSSSLDYTIPAGAPEGTIACVNYKLGERSVGQAYLTLTSAVSESGEKLPEALISVKPTVIAPPQTAEDPSHFTENDEGTLALGRSAISESSGSAENEPAQSPFHISFKIPILFWQILLVLLLLTGSVSALFVTFKKRRERETAELLERRRRRAERLRETGISEAEFDLMIQSRRQTAKPHKKRGLFKKRDDV